MCPCLLSSSRWRTSCGHEGGKREGPAAYGDRSGFRKTSYTYIAPEVDVENAGAAAQRAPPTVTTGYNAFGETVAVRDARGNIARTTYDLMGRPAIVTAPLYTP